MSEHDSFATCAAALAELLAHCTPQCQIRLASFSKAVTPLPGEQASSALASLRLRSVSRYDLALEWLHSTLVTRPSVDTDNGSQAVGASRAGTPVRLAVLLGDGGATDELGFDPPADHLLSTAHKLAESGIRLVLAAPEPQGGMLSALAQAGRGELLHPAALTQTVGAAVGLGPRPGPAAGSSADGQPAAPAASAGAASAELSILLESRLQGLTLRHASRLRPAPACLIARSSLGSWQLGVGSLAPWDTLELLLELGLPLAPFGTGEGPAQGLTAALLDSSGARLAVCQTALDFSADPRRAQQLGTEADQARRLWELAAVDSWPTGLAAERRKRQTGHLPPPGPLSAPPAGGVPG